jgi:hypothetical protein
MNEFVEVVLVEFNCSYCRIFRFGLWVIQNAGFGMAFQTMPLFEQWGSTLAVVAGVCWFGLLFFAITSLYGNTWMGSMRDVWLVTK